MPAACVLDASAAMALLSPSQSTEASRAFEDAPPGLMLAPTVFPIEVRHGVLKLERRGSVAAGDLDVALGKLERGIELAAVDLVRASALAREEALGMYDALYLDLALARGVALASRDAALLDAARRRSVETIDLR
jgi:predicted nucleic acid-binding protein